MDNQPTESQKPSKKERNRKANRILLPIVGILFLIIIIIAIASALGGPHKKAKYQATLDITNAAVVNPATLSVSFHVKNVGNAAGQPWCTIQVGDVNDTYTGTDYFQLSSPIQPGQTSTSADSLTITKQGAQYVTQGTITCN